jgi:hypothetical protein
MPFTKQDKNINSSGRPKGSLNRNTAEIKTLLLNVFNDNLDEIHKQQTNLTLQERIALNKTLLPYILPNVKTESFSNNLEPSIFDTSNW